GVIGNIYSTGLAVQALVAAHEFYAPREWDCPQAVSAITEHRLQLPMAIAQALPGLVGRSYLDAAGLNCSTTAVTATSPQPEPSPEQPVTPQEERNITVHYTITNHLRGQNFSYSIKVEVPAGSVLLAVLEEARDAKPDIFSFETKPTSWGPMVVSIHGLEASDKDRTFWMFLSGTDALQEGVGMYVPRDGEHIQAVFSTY
ncbi:IF factor, partial [Alectura lathami]|nr:IF factor [Alectura lathami]